MPFSFYEYSVDNSKVIQSKKSHCFCFFALELKVVIRADFLYEEFYFHIYLCQVVKCVETI